MDALTYAIERHEHDFRRRLRATTIMAPDRFGWTLPQAQQLVAMHTSGALRRHRATLRLGGEAAAALERIGVVVNGWTEIVRSCGVLLALRGAVIRDGRVEVVRGR